MMKFTIIESPYAASDRTGTLVTVDEHMKYLHRCIKDSILREECPYASHLMNTGALDDNIPEERKLGIEIGFYVRRMASQTAFYTDYGISSGMLQAIQHASGLARDRFHAIVYRTIGKNP